MIEEYSKAVITGNQLQINIALQALNSAITNLLTVDDFPIIGNLTEARDLIIEYNKIAAEIER